MLTAIFYILINELSRIFKFNILTTQEMKELNAWARECVK